MNTALLLMAQHEKAVLDVETVAREYFGLDVKAFQRRCSSGDIRLPIAQMDPTSQKSPRVVHVSDLADWIDARRAEAQRAVERMGGQ